ncbi:MAG: hypothetical protein ACQEQS_11390 [Thermodesulfobacteriota bacterium]
MKNSTICKPFFLFIIFIFVYTPLSASDYEEKIKNNFLLSDKLNKLSEEIKKEEQSYLDRIKNLKIKLYMLEAKKEKLSDMSEKSRDFYEEKLNEYKSIISELEIVKKKLPDFLKNDFLKKKEELFSFFDSENDFSAKLSKFKTFMEEEIRHCLKKYFKTGTFIINEQKVQGKAFIAGNSIVIVKTEKNRFYLWNKQKQEYEIIDKPYLKKLFKLDDLDEKILEPFFLDLKNEAN